MIKRITQEIDGTITIDYFPEPLLDENGEVQFDENGDIIMESSPE